MLKNILIVILLGNIMLADFKTMSTKDVQAEITKGAILIDIRREDEWKKYGLIEGSHRLTFFDKNGKYDVDNWMKQFTKIVKSKEQKFILICAYANRTKTVGAFLSIKLGYQNVYELDHGINDGWINKGFKTTK